MNFEDYEFFHVIELPDGRVTPGVTDHRDQPRLLGIDAPGAVRGRVLDVGANDGFWSFWAERAGASEVLAVDVESYADYDWGHQRPVPGAHDNTEKRRTFDALREQFRSSVRREKATVYELSPERHGLFDLIFFYGVLYHLRHPLLALDRLRKVCSGALIVETHVANRAPFVPSMLFYWDDVFDGPTNWCGPSEACVATWMRSAGFDMVYREEVAYDAYSTRQRFVGTLTEEWRNRMAKNGRFRCCDAAYFRRVRDETRRHLGLKNA